MANVVYKTIPRSGAISNDVFIGIDSALRKIGVCILDGPSAHFAYIKTKGLTGSQRIKYMYDAISKVVEHFDGRIVAGAVENGSYGSGGRIYELGGANFIAQLVLVQSEIPFIMPAPSQLKKFWTGHGSSDKERMVKYANDRLEERLKKSEDDLADAFALAHLAEQFKSRSPSTRKQADVIVKLSWQ